VLREELAKGPDELRVVLSVVGLYREGRLGANLLALGDRDLPRTWVTITNTVDGGWGIGGHGLTNADLGKFDRWPRGDGYSRRGVLLVGDVELHYLDFGGTGDR